MMRAAPAPLFPAGVMLAAATVAACMLTILVGGAQAQTPAAIAAPDATPVVTLHAEGAQLYECKAGGDGKSWVFREPIATLILDGKSVGRHYIGPTWEHMGGSAVTGKFLASSPGATANDIPWLKLEVASRRGKGMLADIDIVQRINTSGGTLHGPCEQTGALRSVPYSADYIFLRKGG
jgi:Protein of unknown function (DUF3455)